MSRKLELAPNLVLPIEAVTKKFGFFGQNGSGKTYGAMKLAELMLGAGGQIVAIDPVGKWYGLRLAANGKDPSGIEIPVFGGLHGDIPLESTAGELVADVIVDRGISAVLDVSQFEYDAERARFVEHFCRRIFHRKKAAPSAIHIYFEEAQEFLPMAPQRGEEKLVHEALRLGKIGRNYGFGWSLITPRPQEITTKARNLSEVVLAFQTNGTHERKAIAEWVKEKGEDQNVVDLLPKLKPGFAHAWSPSWLEFSGTVHINKKETFDASATPLVGAKAVEAKPLGTIDLAQLQKAMAATIEKRKAEDPAELKKQLAAANGRIRQLEKAPASTPARVVEKAVVDRAAIDRAVARALADVQKDVGFEARQIRQRLARVNAAISPLPEIMDAAIAMLDLAFLEGGVFKKAAQSGPPVIPINGEPLTRIVKPVSVPRAARPDIRPSVPVEGVSPAMQRILDATAAFEQLGISPAKRINVAFFAGYTENGHFNNMVGSLRTAGLIDYPGGGIIQLTHAGRAVANASANAIQSLDDLHNTWIAKLSPSEGKLLKVLIDRGVDNPISRAQLAADTGYTENGHFNNMVGHLRTLGAAAYPSGGTVVATDVLFPPGLN